jgi:polyribonucleotide nucleotidyltransferase
MDTDDMNVRGKGSTPPYEDERELHENTRTWSYMRNASTSLSTSSITGSRRSGSNGRAWTQIRPLAAEVGVIPRVLRLGCSQGGRRRYCHSHADYARRRAETRHIKEEEGKRFKHHYTSPGFSTARPRPQEAPADARSDTAPLAERPLSRDTVPVEDIPTPSLVSEVLALQRPTSRARMRRHACVDGRGRPHIRPRPRAFPAAL